MRTKKSDQPAGHNIAFVQAAEGRSKRIATKRRWSNLSPDTKLTAATGPELAEDWYRNHSWELLPLGTLTTLVKGWRFPSSVNGLIGMEY
jgi:hypothetical protein